MFRICGFTEIDLYNYIGFIAVAMFLIGNLWRIKEKTLCYGFQRLAEKGHGITSRKVTLLLILEIILLSFVQGYYVGLFNTQFGNLVGTGANYFGLMLCSPLLIIVLSLLLRANPLTQLDYITPTYPLALIPTKIACFCCGCCTGIPWSYGYLNYYGKQVEFPVQMVECLVAFLLFLFMRWYQKRGKSGTCFPVYLTTYSALRFFTEFLRIEENVFGFMNLYQIICLGGILLGLIYYMLVYLFSDRIKHYYDEKMPSNVKLTDQKEFPSIRDHKGSMKYLIAYIVFILMLLIIFGNFLIIHPSLLTICIAVSFVIFVLLIKTLFSDIKISKLAIFSAYILIFTFVILYLSPLKDNNHFNHVSVYSFLLSLPLITIPLILLHIPYKTLLSMSVLCECYLLIIRKSLCMANKCCLGQYLPSLDFEFPSHLSELAVVLLLFIIFLWIMRNQKDKPTTYAWFLFFFGMVHLFLLNFRYESNPSAWNIANGYIWPLLLIGIAILWFIFNGVYNKCSKTKRSNY